MFGTDLQKLVIVILTLISIAQIHSEEIKIGTLIPAASSWGNIFKVWADAVAKLSSGNLTLKFFYNGMQGDEADIVNKLKNGQLDIAHITSVGLGRIYKPILALQMPGLFKSWSKLDLARQEMNVSFQKGFKDAGFNLLGWTDFGAVRLFSNGPIIRIPGDMKGKKLFINRYNLMEPFMYQTIGELMPRSLSIFEVLPELITGTINIVNEPTLLTEQLQWSSHLNTMNSDVNGLVTGALVISTKRFDGLTQDFRNILLNTAKVVVAQLTQSIRTADDAAYARMKQKMRIIMLTDNEISQWNGFYKQVRLLLTNNIFSPDLVIRLEQLAT